MIRKTILASAASLVALPAFAADIVIGVPNWPSVNVTAHILEAAIEQNLGLDVELQNGTNPIIFEAMDKGAMHLHPEVWLPNQENLRATYVDEKGTVVTSPNFTPAFQAMCVPKAFAEEHGITSIEQLTDPDIAALFDTDGNGVGEIWIGAPGWASTNVEKIRARSYGYAETMELTESDETLAYAGLDNAIRAGDPWVGFCYAPHYVFTLHDMVVLEEPEHDPDNWTTIQPTDSPSWLEDSFAASAWKDAELRLHYAASLEEDHPQVAALFRNMALTTDEISQFTYAMVVDGVDVEEYAAQWVADNEDRILGWMAE